MAINEEARIPVYLNDEQARQALKNLTAEAEKWRQKMREAAVVNDMKGMKDAERELKKVTNEANRLKKEAFDVNKVLSNLGRASINELNKSVTTLRKQMSGLNRDSKEYLELNKQLNRVINERSKITGKITSGKSNFLSGLLPTLGVAGVVSGLTSFVRSMVNVRAEFEKYEAVLTNSLGSQQQARKEMQMLQDFATKTPFALSELTGAFVKLNNYGLKPTREELQKYGDLAASVGKGFDQLVEAVADAVTGEFERLKEFGIKASKEGDKITFTFKEQKTTIENSAEAIKAYIQSLGDLQGVTGSMEAISKTVGGKISNLGDAWDNMLNKMGERTSGAVNGIITMFTNGINKISKQLEILNAPELNFWQKWWGSTVGTKGVYKNLMSKRASSEAAAMPAAGAEAPTVLGDVTVKGLTPEKLKALREKNARDLAGLTDKARRALIPAAEDPLKTNEWSGQAIRLAEEEAQRLAEKKASEAEWTAFLKGEIDKRMDAEAKALEIEREIADARMQLKEIQVQAIGDLASTLAGMFEQGSAAQIAMIAVEKAIAIAQIWMNLAKEKSAINLAAANIAAMPIPGARVASIAYASAMTAKALAQAKINTGLIVAQTVASSVSSGKREKTPGYATGGFTGYGADDQVAGLVHKNEFVVNANALRNPEVRRAVSYIDMAQKSGKIANTQAATNGTQPGSGIDAATARELTKALNRFADKKLVVYTELIKKDLENLDEIDNKRGLKP